MFALLPPWQNKVYILLTAVFVHDDKQQKPEINRCRDCGNGAGASRDAEQQQCERQRRQENNDQSR